MKSIACGLGSLLLAAGLAWGEAVPVYDVGVEPDSANKKVAVTYRMAETNGGVANVAVDISSDAGDTWTVPANTFYPGSDIGPGIPADGSLRQFVWDARADWNNQYSTQMLVRINATAAEAQSGIYYLSSAKLYRMNLDGTANTLLYDGLPKSCFLTADETHNRLLFSTWYSGSPVWTYNTLQGGAASQLLNGPGYSGGQGIAYDPAAATIFAGLYYNGLYAYNEGNAQGWQRIVSASALSPMIGQRGQIEVDPAHQHVYFRSAYNGTCDQCRWIWRVDYTGSNLTQIVRANGGDAMTLDLVNGKIYFSDEPGNGTIYRCNLDGSGLETVLTVPAPYIFCISLKLDVANNKMYLCLINDYVSWEYRAISRANLDGSGYEILREYSGTGEGYAFDLFLR
ncbi:MAG: hypothetical protein AB7V22_03385 [Kiritimatiellia bacterium]